MNRISLLSFSLFTFCLGLILPTAATPQTAPERDYDVKGEIDPFLVAIYADADYGKYIHSWKLPPGMRMLKIPEVWSGGGFNPYYEIPWVERGEDWYQRPKSILLGSKVGVYLFPRESFSSLTVARGERYHLLRDFPLLDSTPLINSPLLGDVDHFPRVQGTAPEYSLVIHRKDIPDLLGVYLSSGDYSSEGRWGQFYSLPAKIDDTAMIFNQLPPGGPFKLSLVAGGNHQLAWSAKGGSHPNANDIEIIVNFANGSSRKLPEKTTGSPPASWDLDPKKGFISSLQIRYVGPYRAEHYSREGPHKHRAPPARKQTPAPPVQVETLRPGQAAMPPMGELEPLPGTDMSPTNALPQAETMSLPQGMAPGPAGPEGWCCRAGEVFRGFRGPCEETSGVLFPTPQEAHHRCQAQRDPAPPPMPPPRGAVPQGRQPEGWCCRHGEVFPVPPHQCELAGGVFFPHPEAAERACRELGPREPRAEPRPEEPGWCCRHGEVFQGLLRHCEEMGGIPFRSPEEAHHHCAVGSGRPGD